MTITWPTALEARGWNAHPRNMMATGGRSPTGREQRVFSDAGFWEIVVSGIRVRNRKQAAAYRAMLARLRGGEDILVPVRDCYMPVGANSTGATGALSADADLRSTTIALTVSGVDVAAGHHMTIGDRLYLIERVVSGPGAPPALNIVATDSPWSDDAPWTDAVSGSAAYTVKIAPPTRADLDAGEPARFRDMLVRCVLKDAADGDLDLDLGRFGSPTLTFIESL